MVFVENLDWRFDKAKDEYVIPDVMIICDRNNIHKGQYHGVPKFIVETLSPSTALKDKGIKKELYAQKGVEEYWIVNARAHSIDIYHLKEDYYILSNTYLYVADDNDEDYNADKGISLKAFPHIKITLADIFENV
ncbi:MAG: Uma2 family endonuclease [Lachnospiraceae bacterium]